MINELTVENFRCYPQLKVKDLRRVNVLVGGNSTGKTALLESIFLAGGGSPELALRLQNFRGMGTTHEVTAGDGVRALWKDLFYKFDQTRPIRISMADAGPKPRMLKVSLVEDDEVSLPINDYEGSAGVVRTVPIEFEWTDGNGVYKSRPSVENGRIVFSIARSTNLTAFFPAQFRFNPEETAKRVSELSKDNELYGLIELIQAVYEGIESVSVEHNAGSWQTFVKVKELARRLPVGLYSAGATKFLTLVFGIASMKDGSVLIDEIENGFYYKRYAEMWRAIYFVAHAFRCQLFISTHSNECLRALLPLLEEHENHFSLLYTSKQEGIGKVVASSGSAMRAAISENVEIR